MEDIGKNIRLLIIHLLFRKEEANWRKYMQHRPCQMKLSRDVKVSYAAKRKVSRLVPHFDKNSNLIHVDS